MAEQLKEEKVTNPVPKLTRIGKTNTAVHNCGYKRFLGESTTISFLKDTREVLCAEITTRVLALCDRHHLPIKSMFSTDKSLILEKIQRK